ncbi:hypothetical protein GCM10011519_08720 [Marmoricola endophyticus]|uniref:Uncharacterized protein n=1 Tax=Marmoricola endophyticus TaxID=2040280 RepID=A0A917BCX6_9ACTN|nr:hypothetical protein [Marmoricola endophyticus]GGF37437.1 hypothetical protein GCM10011519_08720 [Marmoricola endophyticus]
MRKLPTALATLGAAGVLAFSGPAFAAGSYTVTAGGQSTGTTAFTGTAGSISFTTPGADLSCGGGTAGGTLNLGTSDGTGIADISSASFSDCVGPLGIPLDVTQTGDWTLNATGTPGAVTDGSITGVSAHVSNPDGQCDFDVTGAVDGNFDSANQQLNVTSGNVLTLSNVNGCFGILNDGDTADFSATYDVVADAGAIAIS